MRAIGEPPFIRFLINSDGTSMIMEPYSKREFQSMRVPKAVYNKTGKMEFRSTPFCRLLSHRLGWEPMNSYRVPGRILMKQGVVLFDLTGSFPIKADTSDTD